MSEHKKRCKKCNDDHIAANRVILDTNIWLSIASGRIDVDSLLLSLDNPVIIVPKGVFGELSFFSSENTVKGRNARLAINMIQKQHLYMFEHPELHVDKALIQVALELSSPLVTLDRELQLLAKEQGLLVYTVVRGRFAKKVL